MTLPAALFSHYRRHPLQLLALVVMILLATMLWTGVHHLTSQARGSLAQSESAIADRQQIRRTDGAAITVEDFVTLRRQGVCVMPWLEVPAPDNGRFVGVDALAAACFPAQPATKTPQPGELDGKPFIDIAEAMRLSENQEGSLSLIVSSNETQSRLPEGYQLAPFAVGPDTGELGESFLLNLDALGILVLLITTLLLRSVYLLGLAQRRDSLALLHRFGIPPAQINRLLVLEISALALACILPGIWLGSWLATALGAGFSEAMAGLFDTPMYAGQSGNWLTPAIIMFTVTLLACTGDLLRPLLQRLKPPGNHPVRALASATLLAGLALSLWAPTLHWVFAAAALVFISSGTLTPLVTARIADQLAAHKNDPLVQWRYREFSVMARRLALPLVALQFAMAMVLAVQALVTTFENTFDQWLGQRLEADFYIEIPDHVEAHLSADNLKNQPVLASSESWHLVSRGRATLNPALNPVSSNSQTVIDVFALEPVNQLITGWQLFQSAEGAWQSLARGEGLMINEQLARRYHVTVGQPLEIRLGSEWLSLTVLGIYPDYGRPAAEVLLDASVLPPDFEASFRSLSVSPVQTSIAPLVAALEQRWGLQKLTVRNNNAIEKLASSIFDQTFLLTRAITTLTLILAAVALLMMGWVFFSTRARYFRLLIVWGLDQRKATGQLLRLALSLAGVITLLAIPLGIWLTWLLVHRINPLAFGWSLPMAIYPRFWLELGVLALLIGLGITVLMRHQLRRPASGAPTASTVMGGER